MATKIMKGGFLPALVCELIAIGFMTGSYSFNKNVYNPAYVFDTQLGYNSIGEKTAQI